MQDRLGDAHQRALARRQLVAQPVGEVRDPEALERFVRGGALVGHPVETGEHAERLADPEALGQRQVAGGEADVLHRLRPAAGRGVPAEPMVPSSGVMAPSSISRVVVLPAPLGPSRPTRSPGATVTLTSFTA